MSYNPQRYEACGACGGVRFRGLALPVCDHCIMHYMDPAWQRMRERLTADNASLDVLIKVDAAIVADCKEIIGSANSARPFRKRKPQTNPQ